MVRAGVVNHPIRWKHGGYREIQDPPERYALLDLQELTALCGFEKVGDFQKAHRDWVEEAIKREIVARESRWTEAIAVGSLSFVNTVKSELGFKAAHPAAMRQFNSSKVQEFKVILDCSNRRLNGTYVLREEGEAYRSHFSGKNETGKLGSRSTYGIVPSLFQPPQISETLTLFRPPFFSFMVTVIKEVT